MYKERVALEIEDAVCTLAVEKPAYGQLRVSNELKKEGMFISPAVVRRVGSGRPLKHLRSDSRKNKSKQCGSKRDAVS